MTGIGTASRLDKLGLAQQLVLWSWGLVAVALAFLLLCGSVTSSRHRAVRATVTRSLVLTSVPRGPASHLPLERSLIRAQRGQRQGYSPGMRLGGMPGRAP